MKKPPHLAFVISEPRLNGYNDAFCVRLVAVMDINLKEQNALIKYRMGAAHKLEWVSFSTLVSVGRWKDIYQKISKNLDTLVGIAPASELAAKVSGCVSSSTEIENALSLLPHQ